MDGSECSAVLNGIGLTFSQHAFVDPLQIVDINSQGERYAGQESQCELSRVSAQVGEGRPQVRTVLQCYTHVSDSYQDSFTSSGNIPLGEIFFMSNVSLTSSSAIFPSSS